MEDTSLRPYKRVQRIDSLSSAWAALRPTKVSQIDWYSMRGTSLARSLARVSIPLKKEAFMKYIWLMKKKTYLAGIVKNSLSVQKSGNKLEICTHQCFLTLFTILPGLIIGWKKNVAGSFWDVRSILSPF